VIRPKAGGVQALSRGRLDGFFPLRYVTCMTTPRSQTSDDSRDQRLKAALKANIARRKAQARARADPDPTDPPRGTEPAPQKDDQP